jgi:hypothetical protein
MIKKEGEGVFFKPLKSKIKSIENQFNIYFGQ